MSYHRRIYALHACSCRLYRADFSLKPLSLCVAIAGPASGRAEIIFGPLFQCPAIAGPALHVHAARLQWQAVPLAERMRWDQSSDSIMVWLQLPSGTTKRDVTVDVSSVHLTGWTVSIIYVGRLLRAHTHTHTRSP
eukprot:scaffold65368_cov19-Tisochrysis_lutea.AAC.2